MGKLDFGEKWIEWIEWCLSMTSFSIVVNGMPSDFFKSLRGLRQRDPLLPYLFVRAIEVLSCFLRKAMEEGFLTGCKVRGSGNEGIDVSHLLLANDTLFFCKASQDHIMRLYWLLMV